MLWSILLTFSFGVVFSLECKKAWPRNCQYNSTCEFVSKVCNHSSSTSLARGGTYCVTLIEKDDHQKIVDMDCMYDQEISKTCKNQSTCRMKYTNSQKSYLHCCCDQQFCNLNFTISSDPLEASDLTATQEKWWGLCDRKWLCVSMVLVLIVSMLLIIIIALISRKKFLRSFEKCLRYFVKSDKSSIGIKDCDEEEAMLDESSIDPNQLTIDGILKRGRFSTIHKGFYQQNNVAIKILISHNPTDQSATLFQNEKTITSLPFFQHQNILRYYGYGQWNDKLLLVSELSEDGSLRDVLRSRLLKDEKELILIFKEISEGVRHLHSEYHSNGNGNGRSSIAHRDLKSENILYINSNRLVLCDFAMSTLIQSTNQRPNQQQQVGTARYMSPELLAGTIGSERDALLKCDVYALGIIFWEVLSRYPFKDCSCDRYVQPFEEELLFNHCNVNNPTVNDMSKLLSLASPQNRPRINPLWKESTLSCFESIVELIEDCWTSAPESRISAATVHLRINQI